MAAAGPEQVGVGLTLRSFLGLLRDHWKLITLVTLLAGAISAGLTARMTPLYSSSLTFYVSAQTKSSDAVQAYQADLLSQQKVQSYADLLTGPMLAGEVASRLGQPMTTAEIQAELSAQAVPQTVLLTVTVTNPSPQQAQAIARTIGVLFPRQVDRLERPAGGGTSTVLVTIVAAPNLPAAPVSPRPVKNVGLALGIGLLLGIGIAVGVRSLDTTIRTTEQAARSLGGKPVLGIIPYDSAARSHPVLSDRQLASPRMEAFRKLRLNLQFVEIDKPRKVLLFTSALPNDGKSTTVCNLAIALSPAGNRVIIVECDLRRPKMGGYLGLPNGAGLTDVLLGRAVLEDVVQHWGDDELDVLTSGVLPPNPSDLLGSRRMAELIEHLRASYDMVLIDMPPLLPFADAAATAPYCDGVIVVARYGRTRAEHLRRVAESLAAVGSPVLAAVLSMTPRRNDDGYGYGYRHYRHDHQVRRQSDDAQLAGVSSDVE
jgi:capsular exopolysaccharide synthesis family protein